MNLIKVPLLWRDFLFLCFIKHLQNKLPWVEATKKQQKENALKVLSEKADHTKPLQKKQPKNQLNLVLTY